MINTDRVKWIDEDFEGIYVSIDGSNHMDMYELAEAFVKLKDALKVYEEDLKESREF